MITVAFLAVLGIALLGGARIAMSIFDQHRRSADWRKDEWWR